MAEPGQLSGFFPFWFWNDQLDSQEIRWQIQQMADQGIKGFFIHSRQGLQQPYLSESYFAMVDVAIEAAQASGLSVHLYDEYPYPSGIAGGEVVLGQPEHAATELQHQTHDSPGGPIRLCLPQGRILSCQAFPLYNGQPDWSAGVDLLQAIGMVLVSDSYRLTGLTQYNRKRYFASQPTPVLETVLDDRCQWRIMVSAQCELRHFKYWDKSVDVLNPEAMVRFRQLTHERYRQRYSRLFGTTILSMFTDEIAPDWSSRIPAAFEAAYAYRIEDAMVALASESHPDHLRVAHDLHRLKYRLFCESYEQPVATWCQTHGLAYTGEKPVLRLSQLKYSDIPGCDPGHVKVGARLDMLKPAIRSNARAVASAGYFYGKAGTLCECFHSLGWSATLQDAKYLAEGLFLMGISMLVPHGCFYSTHALKKHDAPPSFFFQMPYWPFFRQLSARIEWLQQQFRGTWIDAEILVVEPTSGLPSIADQASYSNLLWFLMGQHLDFHLVDTDILLGAAVEDGLIRLADLKARLLLVPPMPVIETSLQDCLRQIEAAGAVVRYARDFTSPEALHEAIHDQVQAELKVQVAGLGASDILTVKRRSADRTLWFLLNSGNTTLQAVFSAPGPLSECRQDGNPPSDFRRQDDHYTRTLAPFESLILEQSPVGVEGAPFVPPVLSIRLPGSLTLHCANANLLRMERWDLTVGDDVGNTRPVGATPLMNQLIEGQFPYVPDYQEYFGQVASLSLPTFDLSYAYRFENHYQGPTELVMEPGSIVGDWQLRINGGPPFGPTDFAATASHVRGSLGLDISAGLRPGDNLIQVQVRTGQPDGGLRNPLYLAGRFGVMLDPVCLVPAAKHGGFEQYLSNLLPFYAGVIEYGGAFECQKLPVSGEIQLQLEPAEPFHEASEISVNGGPFRPLLWQPRRLSVPVSALKIGGNQLRVRVHTSLIRSFEGQWFDYQTHGYRDIVTNHRA